MSDQPDQPYPEGIYFETDPSAEYEESEESAPSHEGTGPSAFHEAPTLPPPVNGTESVAPLTEGNGSEPAETRRGMRRYRKGDVEIEEGDDEEGEILVVSVRLRHGASKRRTYEMEEAEPRSKIKRLTKGPAQVVAASPASPVSPAAAPVPAIPSPVAPAVADAPPPGAPLMKLTPRTAQGAIGRDQWGLGSAPSSKRWFLLLAGLAAAAVGYMIGHRSSTPANAVRTSNGRILSAPPPKLTGVWPPSMVTQLDAVLTADAAGDIKTARTLATDLKKQFPNSPDLTLYISTLQTRTGDYNDAEVDVSKLIDPFAPPLQSAAVNSHLGFIYARHRDFPRAVAAFADAAAADPFSADYFRQWAEALRRSGQVREAIDHFRQALVRLPVGQAGISAQREDIEFKIRLAQIEGGKDDDSLKAAIDSHLQGAAPTGYWLMTAAAFALQHNDMTTAADTLRRAQRAVSTDDYATLTNDYFFHAYAVRKEMAGLLAEDTPEARILPFMPRMGTFVDP